MTFCPAQVQPQTYYLHHWTEFTGGLTGALNGSDRSQLMLDSSKSIITWCLKARHSLSARVQYTICLDKGIYFSAANAMPGFRPPPGSSGIVIFRLRHAESSQSIFSHLWHLQHGGSQFMGPQWEGFLQYNLDFLQSLFLPWAPLTASTQFSHSAWVTQFRTKEFYEEWNMLLNRTPRYCASFFMGGSARCNSLFEHAPDH